MVPQTSAGDSKGFTLVELVMVVAIISILAIAAIPMFMNFIKQAKMVEAETALAEIKRLEERYFGENLFFSNNLSTIGYNSILQYYAITIQLNGAGPPPFLYKAMAIADLDNDPDLDAWVLTVDLNMANTLQHGCIPGGVGPVQFDCTD
jgi:prepilin-type N-terminal cleavage/methylation domain-containing protein